MRRIPREPVCSYYIFAHLSHNNIIIHTYLLYTYYYNIRLLRPIGLIHRVLLCRCMLYIYIYRIAAVHCNNRVCGKIEIAPLRGKTDILY